MTDLEIIRAGNILEPPCPHCGHSKGVYPLPYILLAYDEREDPFKDLSGCTHFELDRRSLTVWCDHGAWEGSLRFTPAGKLESLYVKETKRVLPIFGYKLTADTVEVIERRPRKDAKT